MADRYSIIIAGGGTGGHLFPALAIGEKLLENSPNLHLHYIGSRFGVEATIFPKRNIEFSLLPIRGLQRGFNFSAFGKNTLLPGRLLFSLRKVKKLFLTLNPKVVVGTGGYGSALPLYEAQKKGVPTLIQEQNSYPGLTTRKFSDKANHVCVAFPEACTYIRKGNCIVTGNPVRKTIAEADHGIALDYFQLSPSRKTLFLFGGSQGSMALNHAMQTISKTITERGFQILWQTGARHIKSLKKFETEFCRVLPFIDKMNLAYAAADLVLSRAGALTLSEMTLCGKPSILVPFPGAAANHQSMNAFSMAKSGAAYLIPEKDMSPESLLKEISLLIKDSNKLKTMSKASLSLAKPQAAEDISNLILTMAEA